MKKRPPIGGIFVLAPRTGQDTSRRTESPLRIDEKNAYCRGGELSGHPGVYLSLHPRGKVTCPYCSQVFQNPPKLTGGTQ